ncbi:dicarboxylate/amino acid:cation symporter [Breznakiella homolactica]|uniref:Dicarboxylate/amino acid:cation symporter n=1 Tax=Breznakiella homolactica TaxID=2798577 RepID=A0A7T8BBP1_9SPIR|nr:cation:dicarboxylase symporter family transporter [Breznakiella homolactica]QQO10596.1 cation:dicarboxylase symporter family transporter [Breznakiella homolactica]
MKVWLKLLIGSVLGLLIGFLLPHDNQTIQSALAWLERFAIQIGRYATIPILFFALTISIYELRQDNRLWRLILRTLVVMVISTVLMVALGIIVTLLFPPARIPILIEEQRGIVSLDLADGIMEIFPSNMFSALVSQGVYLLPVCVFAFFLGMGLSYDRNYTKQVISLIDSLSRIFFHIAAFFSEILGLIIIILGAYWAVRFRDALRADVFRDLILLLGVFGAVLGFGIMPLFLYLLKPKTNPWKILYGSIGPALAGFFSGDINFTLPVLFRHSKENLGIQRRSNTVTTVIFANFGRAGSAMVAAMAFIVIIKSYSSLGVTMADVMAIALRCIIISMLLPRQSGNGAHAALAVLCTSFGRGFEAGYLILRPIAFYLIAIGTFLDIMLNTIAGYAIARMSGFQEEKEIRHFI